MPGHERFLKTDLYHPFIPVDWVLYFPMKDQAN